MTLITQAQYGAERTRYGTYRLAIALADGRHFTVGIPCDTAPDPASFLGKTVAQFCLENFGEDPALHPTFCTCRACQDRDVLERMVEGYENEQLNAYLDQADSAW
ncbi:hypothetical protein [Deinococcus ruber]|uniref:Uncharacterized protein n=1 Tax=Deinococcus ruber TaxID=1848197 RepID=A0A918C7E8_9DEIO|nr:hypothetical protein [Deinococcus ruber]GGR09664.1 hypothetical protein GCM10008957_23010 [Deinococcus ruber]